MAKVFDDSTGKQVVAGYRISKRCLLNSIRDGCTLAGRVFLQSGSDVELLTATGVTIKSLMCESDRISLIIKFPALA